MKLTIICLSAAMMLVFAGTLAQVQLGIQIVQERYFQSIFVWWPSGRDDGFRIPVFPGGHLIGGVLLVNLIARPHPALPWTWRNLGIQLTHGGLIIMLAGGLLTDLFSVESHMRIDEGETKNYSEEYDARELALIDTSDPDFDQVTAIPAETLKRRAAHHRREPAVPDPVKELHRNSKLQRDQRRGTRHRTGRQPGRRQRASSISRPGRRRTSRRNAT